MIDDKNDVEDYYLIEWVGKWKDGHWLWDNSLKPWQEELSKTADVFDGFMHGIDGKYDYDRSFIIDNLKIYSSCRIIAKCIKRRYIKVTSCAVVSTTPETIPDVLVKYIQENRYSLPDVWVSLDTFFCPMDMETFTGKKLRVIGVSFIPVKILEAEMFECFAEVWEATHKRGHSIYPYFIQILRTAPAPPPPESPTATETPPPADLSDKAGDTPPADEPAFPPGFKVIEGEHLKNDTGPNIPLTGKLLTGFLADVFPYIQEVQAKTANPENWSRPDKGSRPAYQRAPNSLVEVEGVRYWIVFIKEAWINGKPFKGYGVKRDTANNSGVWFFFTRRGEQ